MAEGVFRTVAAYDGSQIVGTSGSFLADTTVPGGKALPAALVTIVTVAATHRRQGILTNMMRRLLEEAHERGEPIATLWASESIIYGRFGYGMAGQNYHAEIDRHNAALAHSLPSRGSVSFATREQVREVGPGVWTRTMRQRPGMPERSQTGWEVSHPLPDDETQPDKRLFYAVYEEDGRADGYIAYRSADMGTPEGLKRLNVTELIAASDTAHAALLRFVLNIDLSGKITFGKMALDDPLWWMLADPRRLKRTAYDAIWLRLLDVPAALAARRYALPGEVTIEVEDDFCPRAGGRFTLEAGPDGAECKATRKKPDLTVPSASLAACYLGGAQLTTLAMAGRAGEHKPGALARADAMFAAERAPWCPMDY
jgi:predicted acetyltransferase